MKSCFGEDLGPMATGPKPPVHLRKVVRHTVALKIFPSSCENFGLRALGFCGRH